MDTKLPDLTYTIDLQPGEKLTLPSELVENVGPGRWILSVRPVLPNGIRCHDAFLNGYAPEDEGLYDDPAR